MHHKAPGSAALLRPAARKATSAVAVHPSLWLGHQLGRSSERGLPTGFALLDAELPGGGWPRRALSELLWAQMGMGEVRLLAPSLVATQQAGRVVMLFDPPAALSALALAQMGLDVSQLLLIQTREAVATPAAQPASAGGQKKGTHSNSLWALEQVLKSGHVGAVVAWLPAGLRPEYVRRLQLAAQHHAGPAFMLRPWWGPDGQLHTQPSAAPLRLGLKPVAAWQTTAAAQTVKTAQAASAQQAGAAQLSIQLFKRKGPPRLQPLLLNLPSVLAAHRLLRAEAARPLRPATFVNLA